MSTAHETARAWLLYAGSDLSVVRAGPSSPGILPETRCFHAQQAAEKAIKAVLTVRGVEFPRSHNIGELLDLIPVNLPRPADLEQAVILTDYAVAARYPGESEPLTADDVAAAAELAALVVAWAEAIVAQAT